METGFNEILRSGVVGDLTELILAMLAARL